VLDPLLFTAAFVGTEPGRDARTLFLSDTDLRLIFLLTCY